MHAHLSAACVSIVLGLITAGVAQAEPARLNTEQYLRATSCVAYANLSQLRTDAIPVQGLAETLAVQSADKSDDMKRRAARETAQAVRAGLQAGTDAARITQLRARRDRLCAPFLDASTIAAR